MIIDNHSIPTELMLKYCRVIKLIESGSDFAIDLDRARKVLHDRIFAYAKMHRTLDRREDRVFSLALNNAVIDLTEDMEI